MLTIIFFVALTYVTFKLFVLGIKAAWGIAKVFCTVILFTAFIVGLFLIGLISVAIPVFVIVGLGAIVYNAVFA